MKTKISIFYGGIYEKNSIKPNGTLSKWYDETGAYKVIRSYKRNWRYVVSGEWRA